MLDLKLEFFFFFFLSLGYIIFLRVVSLVVTFLKSFTLKIVNSLTPTICISLLPYVSLSFTYYVQCFRSSLYVVSFFVFVFTSSHAPQSHQLARHFIAGRTVLWPHHDEVR